jgi:hypothetical protein
VTVTSGGSTAGALANTAAIRGSAGISVAATTTRISANAARNTNADTMAMTISFRFRRRESAATTAWQGGKFPVRSSPTLCSCDVPVVNA